MLTIFENLEKIVEEIFSKKEEPTNMLEKQRSCFLTVGRATTRPHGQAVKTQPSHGWNRGSIPRGGAKQKRQEKTCLFCLLSHGMKRTFANANRSALPS